MGTTGWIGEGPEEPPAMPVTAMLLAGSRGEPQPGAVLAQSLARSRAAEAREAREAANEAVDPDEHAAGLVARGYRPGMVSQLAQQLGDVSAQLEAEQEKIEKGKRRAEFAGREHTAGRVDVFRMQAMLDGDFGDEDRVRMLTRRADRLRRQIGEAQAAASQPQRYESGDGVEAATRRAHQAFREVTRARMAEAQAARPAPRPFDSVSRGRSTEHTGDDCWVCEAARRRDEARARADYAAVYGEIKR